MTTEDDGDGDVEAQLTASLLEQRAALEELQAAIVASSAAGGDSSSTAELNEMRDVMMESVREAEASVMELKRARLLGMVAGASDAFHATAAAAAAATADEEEEEAAAAEAEPALNGWIAEGVEVTFRYYDGRFHRGIVSSIISADGGGDEQWNAPVVVKFAHPTMAWQLSEEVRLPTTALQPVPRETTGEELDDDEVMLMPTMMEVGTRVLARDARSRGLWRRAEVVAHLAPAAPPTAAATAMRTTTTTTTTTTRTMQSSKPPDNRRYEIIFSDDGRTAAVHAEHVHPLPIINAEDDNDDDDDGGSSSDDEYSSDDEDSEDGDDDDDDDAADGRTPTATFADPAFLAAAAVGKGSVRTLT